MLDQGGSKMNAQGMEVGLKSGKHCSFWQAEIAIVAGDLPGRKVQVVRISHVLRERNLFGFNAFRKNFEAERNLDRSLRAIGVQVKIDGSSSLP